jgi:preprotein translocase subunit SecE
MRAYARTHPIKTTLFAVAVLVVFFAVFFVFLGQGSGSSGTG